MVRFPEADTRLNKGKYACRNCKSVVRAPNMKILAGKVKCRKCNSKALRPLRKK